MKKLNLEFFGPFSFVGDPESNVFSQDEALHPGIYLWTVQIEEKYYFNYVGMTNKTMGNRLYEHIQLMLSGLYSINDPKRMLQGELNNIWNGLGWGKESWKRAGDFLNRGDDLLPIVMSEIGLYKLFLAPSSLGKRELQRIESGIAKALLDAPIQINSLFPRGIRYNWKRDDEEFVRVNLVTSTDIEGLPSCIDA